MSYMSSKDPVPMSPLNISTKSDASVVSLGSKVPSVDVLTKDGESNFDIGKVVGLL